MAVEYGHLDAAVVLYIGVGLVARNTQYRVPKALEDIELMCLSHSVGASQ